MGVGVGKARGVGENGEIQISNGTGVGLSREGGQGESTMDAGNIGKEIDGVGAFVDLGGTRVCGLCQYSN